MSSRSQTSFSVFQSLRFRLAFVQLAVIALFLVLAGRLVYVQGFSRIDLTNKLKRQMPMKENMSAMRHRLIDRVGNSLAETVPVFSCYADPTLISNKEKVAQHVGKILHIPSAVLFKKLKTTKGSFVWLERNVPQERVEEIKALELQGIAFKKEYRRHYPLGPVASHLLGLVGFDSIGLSGVEQMFDDSLRGGNGDGGDVQLTLDGTIQQIVEKELAWGIDKTQAKRGMAIVQDPKTGEILAMTAWPPISLDPDNPSKSIDMRMPELVDVFEPGSTFKIVTAAAALEENIIRPNERFDGEKGAWKVADIKIHDHEPRKKMTFDEIWMYSSNIGSAKVAERLGKNRLYQYARRFGFGVLPGSGFSCEAKGMLKSPSQWSGISPHVISFGQEIGVTALQLVGAYSAIANGGLLMEPRLIKRQDEAPVVVRRIVSEETARRVTGILTRVVEEGTGREAQVKWSTTVKVAGKTGTAQKINAQGRYDKHLTLLSFCGFFPADDPRYTILILLDEPEGRRWGGLDAAPVFRRIAEQLLPGIS